MGWGDQHLETRLSVSRFCVNIANVAASVLQFRPVALASRYPWYFRILSGSRHLGVQKYISFICGIDRNVPYITGERLYSVHINYISFDF